MSDSYQSVLLRLWLLLLLLLLLGRSQFSCGITVDPTCYFFVEGIEEADGGCFGLYPGVDDGAAVSELCVNSVFDEQELSHHECFDGSAHEVKGQAEYQIDEEENFDSAFSFVDPKSIGSHQVSKGVEARIRKFYLHEFHDVENEKQRYWSVVEIVYETKSTERNVKEVLTVVVQEDLPKILFVELRSFEHSEQTDQ